MTTKRSFFQNLMHRRVLQIVGMYVAAAWLVIELGDWVTERFGLPPTVTSYVFVIMLVCLPAIVLVAYNHGAPGDDDWTRSEKLFVSANLVLAVGVVYLISPRLNVAAAVETVQIPDETGILQEYEVARQGFHKDVTGFFWRNESVDDGMDWLSYGLPLMLAHDMNRVSPVIRVVTPFESSMARRELNTKGYSEFLREPHGLQVQIARDRRSTALIVGSYSQDGESLSLDATLLDSVSGEVIGSYSESGNDWLDLVDRASAAMLEFLEVEPSDNQSNDPIHQHFSESLEAIRHYTNAEIALNVNNDYPAGIAELQNAVEIDPGFAEAHGTLSTSYYFSGDTESARTAVAEALKSAYRLSETSKFVLKANRYIYTGDFDRGERVIEVWSQVRPNSTRAYQSMARLARLRGGEDGLQRASIAYDRLLELSPKDYDIYRRKAEVEQQRGDYVAAAGILRTFLEFEPDNGDVHLQLANVYLTQGDLDASQASLEDASILSDDPIQSELGLARLEARRGLFDAAERRVAAQLSEGLSPGQRMGVITVQAELAYVTGQISRGLTLHAEVNELAKGILPPTIRLVSIESQQATMMAMLGKSEEALALLDSITTQLQPPLDAFLNFSYTTIYAETGDRDAFREWARKSRESQDQLPEVFTPFIEIDTALVAIWDEEFDVALVHLDRARELLGQSVIQVQQDNLGSAALKARIAELYLQANAIEKFESQIDAVLKVFPAEAYAKLILAKYHVSRGDSDAARAALNDALGIWSDADED